MEQAVLQIMTSIHVLYNVIKLLIIITSIGWLWNLHVEIPGGKLFRSKSDMNSSLWRFAIPLVAYSCL